jgi:hypothetical protein
MKILIPDNQTANRFLILSGKPFDEAIDLMLAFNSSIEEWCENYPDGRRLKVTGSSVRISDLIGYIPDCMCRRTSLGTILRSHGFAFINLEVLEATMIEAFTTETEIA